MNKVDKCIHCGMCNSGCPTFRVTGNEHLGPRGRAIMLINESSEKSFFDCSLCGACEKGCPVKIEMNEELRSAREKLVKKGVDTSSNNEMIKNIRKYGNPFGELKEGEIPDKLYCC